MQVLLRDIPQEGLDLSFDADPAALELVDQRLTFGGPIRVRLSVSKQQEMVFATGQVLGEAQLECVRCLKRFSYPLKLGIHAEYLSAREAPAQEEHELTRQDLDVLFYEGEAVEFDDLIREQVLLGIPSYPLCDAACPGLCQRCGQDLSTGRCACAGAEPDPRFSVLKDYFKKQDRRS